MTRQKLKTGILISMIWALSYRLNAQFPNVPSRKIAGIALQVFNSYSEEQKSTIEELKAKAWILIEEYYTGEVNLPIAITTLYWAFPEIYGKRMEKWVDLMDDQIVSHFEDDGFISKGVEISEKYIELVDKVIFDYMKKR